MGLSATAKKGASVKDKKGITTVYMKKFELYSKIEVCWHE